MMFENHCSKGLVTNVYCHVDLNWLFLKRPHYTADTRKEKKKKNPRKNPRKAVQSDCDWDDYFSCTVYECD